MPPLANPEGDDRLLQAAARAVVRWEGFPVDGEPRPLVLLNGDVIVEGGFATGDAACAFQLGLIDPAPGIPQEPVRRMRDLPGEAPRPDRPLQIRAAELGSTTVLTDRGPATLPAWRVDAEDALGPIWVLTDEAIRWCWAPGPGEGECGGPHLTDAVVADDGRTLTCGYVGGPEDESVYDIEVVESSTAISIVPLERWTPKVPLSDLMFRTTEGHNRRCVVQLERPLGHRVIVNVDGTPLEARRIRA